MTWTQSKYTQSIMDIIKRTATVSDCNLVMAWRNSISARGVSRFGDQLSEVDHREWFISRVAKTMSEPFWIMSILNKDIGYVRLDYTHEEEGLYTVSIFVAPEYQAVGNGKKMLKMALTSAVSSNLALHFRAVIKCNNTDSIALFEKFGFKFNREIDKEFHEYQVSASQMLIHANSF